MRFSDKGMHAHSGGKGVFGVNFHDFIEKERQATTFELASEFGLTMRDVRNLKKHLERS
ncbi:hypothetical protein [Bacillus sp. B-jedd]|uniref:hypothetical protein n=1 Tax=Bacillus sp. B-jedd TaxID=1476857 RepID=UPI0005156929|nr:hypothetical protein [Bacillus sp. B-jedd]CEG27988.1 Hypothetical protein BN1002_02865 [Bacillus sp. B-jedd]